MKFRHSLFPLLATTLLGNISGGQAHAAAVFFGRIDSGLRYSSNQDSTGRTRVELAAGAASASRWGLRGGEDMGGGLKTWFMLESGFNPDEGTQGQGGRLFGRQAWIGLSGRWGALTAGRQYTPVYNIEFTNDAFGWANVLETGFIYDNYSGGNRWDNAVRYAATWGKASATLMFAPGEQAGDHRAASGLGGSLAYVAGTFSVGGGYQQAWQARNATSALLHRAWTVGGTYEISPFKFFLSYLNHRSDASVQKNDVFAAGLSHALTPRLGLTGAFYEDRQRSPDGRKRTLAAMLNYSLSGRTNVYLQADHGRIDRGYAGNVFDIYSYPRTRDADGQLLAFVDRRSSVTAGLRHQF